MDPNIKTLYFLSGQKRPVLPDKNEKRPDKGQFAG
jgi:hypothetical protein